MMKACKKLRDYFKSAHHTTTSDRELFGRPLPAASQSAVQQCAPSSPTPAVEPLQQACSPGTHIGMMPVAGGAIAKPHAATPAHVECPLHSGPATSATPASPQVAPYCPSAHYPLQPQLSCEPLLQRPAAQCPSAPRSCSSCLPTLEAERRKQAKREKRQQRKLRQEELNRLYKELKMQHKYQELKQQISRHNGNQQWHTAGQSIAYNTMSGLAVLDIAKALL